jgi:hypothetical protein
LVVHLENLLWFGWKITRISAHDGTQEEAVLRRFHGIDKAPIRQAAATYGKLRRWPSGASDDSALPSRKS